MRYGQHGGRAGQAGAEGRSLTLFSSSKCICVSVCVCVFVSVCAVNCQQLNGILSGLSVIEIIEQQLQGFMLYPRFPLALPPPHAV